MSRNPLLQSPSARLGQWGARHPRVIQSVGIVSVVVVLVYLAIRVLFTSEGSHPVAFWTLLGAEIFSVVTLSLFLYDAWSVPPTQTPPRLQTTTDIVISTYNEPISILEPTIVSSLRARHVSQVWVLDDGKRESVKELCDALGARYIARETNEHAKAGNINHALPYLDAELLLFLDADHVPARDIIANMSGYFTDPRVAIVQSPHDFRNRDSSQHRDRSRHEQSLFYQVLMPAREKSQTAFWSGSAAILRRSSLVGIGGLATETLAEDLHTTLRLQLAGFTVRYHNEVLVSALAPHTTLDYLLQRDRWARGTLKVLLSTESPIFGPGWSLSQRLHYLNNLLYYGIPLQRLAYVAVLLMVFLLGWLPIGGISPVVVLFLIASVVSTALTSVLFSRGKRDVFDGSQFTWLSASIHLKALFDVTLGRSTAFIVTPKVASQLSLREKISAMRLPLIVTTLLAASWVYATLVQLGVHELAGQWVSTAVSTALATALSPAMSLLPGVGDPYAYGFATLFFLLEFATLERLLRREFRRSQVRALWRFQTRLPALVGGRVVTVTDIHESGVAFESDDVVGVVGRESPLSFSPARRMLRGAKAYKTQLRGYITPVRIIELPGRVITAGTLRWESNQDRWEAQDLCYTHLARESV